MTARPVLAVAAGGALGSAARYAMVLAWPTPAGGVPWSTFTVNVVGCLAIGLLLGRAVRPLTRAFLGTGVLGGFTTLSAYAGEIHTLFTMGRPGLAAGYLVGTLVAALGAVHVGHLIARRSRG